MQVDAAMAMTVASYAGALLLNSATSVLIDKAMEPVTTRLFDFVKGYVRFDPTAPGGVVGPSTASVPVDVSKDVERLFAFSPVLRRLRLVRSVLSGASLLWVDDNPSNNIYERMALKSLGVDIELATSTEEALSWLAHGEFDLIISDMARGEQPDAGLQFLRRTRSTGLKTPIIFYVGSVDSSRGVPPGAFGITARPDELMHLILDVLERQRV